MYLVALAREQHFARAAKAATSPSQPCPPRSASSKRNWARQSSSAATASAAYPRGPGGARACPAHPGRMRGHDPGLERAEGRLDRPVAPGCDPHGLARGRPDHGRVPCALSAGHHRRAVAQFGQEIQRGIDNFELEIGLTYLDNEPLEHVRTRPLYREEYILLAPRAGPFADRDTVSWAEAGTVPLCLLTPDMQNRRIIDGIFRAIGASRAPRSRPTRSSTCVRA